MKYLLDEIVSFQKSKILLDEYPNQVKILRHKVNNYIDKKLLYLKQMLYNNEIDADDYRCMKVIIEYEKWKYYNLINPR